LRNLWCQPRSLYYLLIFRGWKAQWCIRFIRIKNNPLRRISKRFNNYFLEFPFLLSWIMIMIEELRMECWRYGSLIWRRTKIRCPLRESAVWYYKSREESHQNKFKSRLEVPLEFNPPDTKCRRMSRKSTRWSSRDSLTLSMSSENTKNLFPGNFSFISFIAVV